MSRIRKAARAARAQLRAGRLGEAERLFDEVLSFRPDHPEALHRSGVAALHVRPPGRIRRTYWFRGPRRHNILGTVDHTTQQQSRFLSVLVLTLVVFGRGCPDEIAYVHGCQLGVSESCRCSDGELSTRTCNEGHQFDHCLCDDSDDVSYSEVSDDDLGGPDISPDISNDTADPGTDAPPGNTRDGGTDAEDSWVDTGDETAPVAVALVGQDPEWNVRVGCTEQRP